MSHAPPIDAARMTRFALVHSLAAQILDNHRSFILPPGDNMVFVIETLPGEVSPVVIARRRVDVPQVLTPGSPELAAALRAADPRGDHWIVCFAAGGCTGGPALSFGVDLRLDATAAPLN